MEGDRNRRCGPDFIVVGAMKAGTSSIARNLGDHPEVWMPEAEVHFFNDDEAYEKGPELYEKQLDPGESGVKIGEKTPTYSLLPKVPERIHRHYPDTHIVWIFRDPVARAYSNYWHVVKKGNELRPWPQAVEDEIHGRIENRWRLYLEASIRPYGMRTVRDWTRNPRGSGVGAPWGF